MKKTNIILSLIFIALVIGFIFFVKWAVPIMGTQTDLNRVKEEKQNINESGIDQIQPNYKITDFLENPIDLQEFKTKKNRNVTTSVNNGLKYQYHPKINDSLFYCYNFLTDSIGLKGVNKIIVFKHGENKHRYEDETEILIELQINNKDSDLGKANLIGLSKTELESEFGTEYLTFDNGIAYSNKNKVLIIELNDSIVNSFNYIKLNTEKINKDLIGQIIK